MEYSAVSTIWIMVGTVLIFFMQAGFAMLETGMTRVKNAGKLEYGEDPMECGLRESNEETGMACDKLELLLSFVSTPGFCDERIWIYKAINPRIADKKLSLDEDEEIETLWLDLETAYEYTRNGKIDDGKTVIAISQMMAERN